MLDFLLYLLAGSAIYLLLFSAALLSRIFCGLEPLSALNVLTVIREGSAAGFRRFLDLKPWCADTDFWVRLKLHKSSTSMSDLEKAFGQELLLLKSLKLAYPASQRRLLQEHYRSARLYIIAREIARANFAENLRKFKDSSQARRSFSGAWPGAGKSTSRPAPPVSGWRTVLGVSSSECNPDTIKKAYRTAMAKAHPDRGGSVEKASALTRAMKEAREEVGFV